jgi:hypothetical protein
MPTNGAGGNPGKGSARVKANNDDGKSSLMPHRRHLGDVARRVAAHAADGRNHSEIAGLVSVPVVAVLGLSWLGRKLGTPEWCDAGREWHQ